MAEVQASQQSNFKPGFLILTKSINTNISEYFITTLAYSSKKEYSFEE